ncbi:MAG: permease [Pseudolabrys sp.]
MLAFAAAATVYARDGREHFFTILLGDVTLFGEMLPKVLAGCLIGAFVTLLLPREMVARWVGHESGFMGLLIAAFFGFLLPGGPITIYPVAGAFLIMGADAGAVVAFIVSWTLIGYTRALVWELPFFGADFVIWRILAALPLPIIAGLLARLAVRAGFEYIAAASNDARHQHPVVAGGRCSGIHRRNARARAAQ